MCQRKRELTKTGIRLEPEDAEGLGNVVPSETKLRDEVIAATQALEELSAHSEFLGKEVCATIIETVSDVHRRLHREGLSVVVVGEKKAGKSTFLNAILGARILGVAARECTGAITAIKKAERLTYQAILRDETLIEFEDTEEVARAKVIVEIEALCRVLGQDVNCEPCVAVPDVAAALEGAEGEHREAERQRVVAEAADRAAVTRLAQATSEHQKVQSELSSASDLIRARERDVAISETQFAERETDLKVARKRLMRWREGARWGDRDVVEQDDLANAGRQLKVAGERLELATAAAPFFARPAPPWKVWIFVLRIFVGWLFRSRLKPMADARKEYQGAQLLAGVAEAAGQREAAHYKLVQVRDLLTQALGLRDTMAGHMQGAKERFSYEKKTRRETHTALIFARRAQDLAYLKVLRARAAKIDELHLGRFRQEVRELTDMQMRASEVAKLTIGFPARHLPEGLTIIDTPGVNTDDVQNRQRAWDVIRSEADGCIVVSDLQQVVSQSTREFLQELRPIIPNILLVMTKMDRALANAEGVGEVDSRTQVEEARQVGIRRFAEEVGRGPHDVFSIAVAAEPVLKVGAELTDCAKEFAAAIGTLFDLLRAERTVIQAARAASAIRYCLKHISEAQARAEDGYKTRLADLEAQRLPDPQEFQNKQLAAVDEALQTHADRIAEGLLEVVASKMNGLREEWRKSIHACETKDEVKETVGRLGREVTEALEKIVSEVEAVIAAQAKEAVKDLEGGLFEELRQRYRIAQVAATATPPVAVEAVEPAVSGIRAADLHVAVAQVVTGFEGDQFAFGAGGAVAGAAIGTMFLPGVGTAIGAAVGVFAGLFKTLDSLKSDCEKEIFKGLQNVERGLGDQLGSVGPLVQRAMRTALERSLGRAMKRFQSWIDGVMAEEVSRIKGEQQKFAHLIQVRESLILHDKRLAGLQEEVVAVSRGLCA